MTSARLNSLSSCPRFPSCETNSYRHIRTPLFMMSSQTWCCISVQADAVLLKPLSDWLWTSQVKRSKGHCGPQAACRTSSCHRRVLVSLDLLSPSSHVGHLLGDLAFYP
ncbi:hypothetical protein KUCAC02_024397 [Chaenocephalus aceratus]|uniref:Uncharacterized protein n=1 Tax=Chaenocephalus aceratus TaxID=36190 RepID=A0ACB9WJD1_CHAAC|nr:hypothetical protein KUCAC02_024397 [Chaenocephalus aceratus]